MVFQAGLFNYDHQKINPRIGIQLLFGQLEVTVGEFAR